MTDYTNMTEEQIIQAEVTRLLRAERVVKAWSPDSLESRPSEKQLEPFLYLASQFKYLYLLGGNQCLAEGTLVATPEGPRPIEQMLPGDTVYDEQGLPIKVLDVFSNGFKPCHTLTCRGKVYAKATAEHVWLLEDGHGKEHERATKDFRRDDKVKRIRYIAALGNKHVPDTYALGALLGDGCSRSKGIAISGQDIECIQKVAELLGASRISNTSKANYTHQLIAAKEPTYYAEWCKNRYAHEKTANLEEIKTWDRSSCLAFIAGLLDTDGSVNCSIDMVNLAITMQAKTILDAVAYLFLALWGIELSIREDRRNKYVNGSCYELYLRNVNEIEIALKELDSYIQIPRKRWQQRFSTIGGKRSHKDKLGLTISESTDYLPTYDLRVDSPRHLYLLANGLVTHNSGKTNGTVRNAVWLAEESSPYWRRPSDEFCNNKLCNTKGNLRSTTNVVLDYECPKCGNIWRVWDKSEPMNIMIVGQQLKNLQENLYLPRIKRLFQFPEDWKEYRLGSPYIQKVTNIKTGNNIIFFPHGHGEEKARMAVQGYTVHAVFTDEQLPAGVAEELQRRVDAKMGIFFSGFTMKHLDVEYLRMIDAQVASGAAKSFKLSKLDNPVYAGSKDIIMKQLAGMSEAKRNAVLYGEVSYSEEYLFATLDREQVMKPVPISYDAKKWRHVEILDPAIKSKAGRLVMAQDPESKMWYAVTAQYLQGMLYDAHLYEAHLRLREKEGYNPILSVADDDAGFIGMARHHANPTRFIYPPSKRAKAKGKLYLIKQTVGVMLAYGICIDAKHTLFWEEINSYRWKDTGNKEIVNSHKYHLLDCLQYFIDTLPDDEKVPEARKSYEQEIVEANMDGFIPKRKQRPKQLLKKKTRTYIMSSSLRPGLMR